MKRIVGIAIVATLAGLLTACGLSQATLGQIATPQGAVVAEEVPEATPTPVLTPEKVVVPEQEAPESTPPAKPKGTLAPEKEVPPTNDGEVRHLPSTGVPIDDGLNIEPDQKITPQTAYDTWCATYESAAAALHERRERGKTTDNKEWLLGTRTTLDSLYDVYVYVSMREGGVAEPAVVVGANQTSATLLGLNSHKRLYCAHNVR